MAHPSNLFPSQETVPAPEIIYNPEGEVLAERYDVSSVLTERLGEDWQAKLVQAITKHSEFNLVDAIEESSREAKPESKFGQWVSTGESVAQELPVIAELYSGLFLDLMRQTAGPHTVINPFEPITTGMHYITQMPFASDYQQAPLFLWRIEAHVDVRPTAVFAIQSPVSDTTGRLVIANQPGARTVEEINADATYLVHKPGTLVCFPRGRELPHYPEEVARGMGQRIIGSFDYLGAGQTPESVAYIDKRIGNI